MKKRELSTEEKFRALHEGTEFLYGVGGPDFGDFGGCGDASAILFEAMKILDVPGVEREFGFAHTGDPGGPMGHVWLVVDGSAIWDPSAWANQYEVYEYDAYDPRRADEFPSGLLEALTCFRTKEIRAWAKLTAEVIRPMVG